MLGVGRMTVGTFRGGFHAGTSQGVLFAHVEWARHRLRHTAHSFACAYQYLMLHGQS